MNTLENFRLYVFRIVAQQMSFRKAAELLHLSQPAVSQQIRTLEEETATRLFNRSGGEGHGNQIALTAAGRILLGYANQAAEIADQAGRALTALNRTVTGDLRLGASTTVAQYILPRILGAFLRQYPHVRLSLLSGNTEHVAEAVLEQRIALGIIEGPAMRRGLKTQRFVPDEMVLIVAPQHPWAKLSAIVPTQLLHVPLLLRERGSGSRRVVERALKAVGLPLRSLQILMELDSTEAILSAVAANLGVGFVSRSAIAKDLRLATLCVVPVEGLTILRDFSFIHLAGSELAGPAAALQHFAQAARVLPAQS